MFWPPRPTTTAAGCHWDAQPRRWATSSRVPSGSTSPGTPTSSLRCVISPRISTSHCFRSPAGDRGCRLATSIPLAPLAPRRFCVPASPSRSTGGPSPRLGHRPTTRSARRASSSGSPPPTRRASACGSFGPASACPSSDRPGSRKGSRLASHGQVGRSRRPRGGPVPDGPRPGRHERRDLAARRGLRHHVTTDPTGNALYAPGMAALMVTGGKLGDLWGRRRAFAIGLVIYAAGSALTAASWSVPTLMLGWSFLEGVGAALVMPALVALVAGNYEGRERALAYGVIGG